MRWFGRASALLLVAAALTAAPASAGLWPDAPDRVKADLDSKDVARRRAAAADLAHVPRKEAIPLLKVALVDSDVEVRLAAASAAAQLRMTEASDLLLPWLTDPAPQLREGACEFFAKLPDLKVVKVLARSLGDSEPRVRLAAVRALGASGSSDAVAPLLARLDDSNSKVRLSVARALGRLGDKRAVTPLVSKVQDEASEVRQAVVRALGDLADPKSSPALVIALRDAAIEVRIEALSALARLKAGDVVASIAPLAIDPSKKPGTADVRRSALAALGRIATPAAVDAIVKAFGAFEDEKVGLGSSPAREAAVAASLAAVPALTAVLEGNSSVSAATAASAAWALGEIAPPFAGATIVKAMRRSVLSTAMGLHALAAAGDASQLPVCLEHVASPDREVRAEALVATARLLDPDKPDGRAVEPLLASLDLAQTPESRAEIALLLGRTGAARVAPVLIGLTAAKDESLRAAAIDALGSLGSAAAGPKLLTLLDDPSALVRLRAGVALGRAGGPDVTGKTVARLSGAQVDRLAVVIAAVGLLERNGDATAVAAAREAVGSLGAERDLLFAALGRAKASGPVLAALLSSVATDVDSRRAIALAFGLATGPADPVALSTLAKLALDEDATVRAQAVWSLGASGTSAHLPVATKLLRDGAPAVATNAAAAIGRIVARDAGLTIPKDLCATLEDDRPYVRANGLAAIRHAWATGHASPCDEERERRLLAEDGNDVVRASAARLLGLRMAKGDAGKARAAIERCTLSDASGAVASVCRDLANAAALSPDKNAIDTGSASLIVFVAPDDGGPPVARAAYAIDRPDGYLHVGAADRRGAVVEIALGKAPVRLRVATPGGGSSTTTP